MIFKKARVGVLVWTVSGLAFRVELAEAGEAPHALRLPLCFTKLFCCISCSLWGAAGSKNLFALASIPQSSAMSMKSEISSFVGHH